MAATIYPFCVGLCAIMVYFYFWQWAEPALPPIVEGFFQPEFMDTAMALRQSMESGAEGGSSFAVYHEGELIIDMWAGYADLEAQRRWRNQTTTLTFDCTKGVLAILLAVLVDKGQLNSTQPISEYWKEFGRNGKESLTLEYLLTHQAGLPVLSESLSLRSLVSDRLKVEKLICDQEPLKPPGFYYHDVTLGLILDIFIQKIDKKGRSIQEVFKEEIAEPFGIEFSMNVEQERFSQTARLQYHSTWRALWSRIKSLSSWLYHTHIRRGESYTHKASKVVDEYIQPRTVFNNPELREITLSSFSGTGSARGLAKLFSFIANGGNHGNKKMLSEEAALKLTESLIRGFCEVIRTQKEYSLGLEVLTNPYGQNVYGYTGYGGQAVYADPANKLAIAYLTNHLNVFRSGDDPRFLALQQSVYKNLDRYTERKKGKNVW